MAERPQQPTPDDRASVIAARFGMTREAAEELLHRTHAEYPSATLPPIEPSAATPIEQAAQSLPTVDPMSMAPSGRLAAKPLSGGFIGAIFLVLLIVLGVALSFRQGCFQRRAERHSARQEDTIQTMLNGAAAQASSPPQSATTVAPGEVPPEALVVPREEPPGTSGPPSNSGITTEAQALQADRLPPPKPTMVTSSNFEAEERLAELRANGKSHSHMKAIRRHGTISYRVFSR